MGYKTKINLLQRFVKLKPSTDFILRVKLCMQMERTNPQIDFFLAREAVAGQILWLATSCSLSLSRFVESRYCTHIFHPQSGPPINFIPPACSCSTHHSYSSPIPPPIFLPASFFLEAFISSVCADISECRLGDGF